MFGNRIEMMYLLKTMETSELPRIYFLSTKHEKNDHNILAYIFIYPTLFQLPHLSLIFYPHLGF